MSKKVYTKVLSGFVDMVSSETVDNPSADVWLAQEDIEVIGFEVFARHTMQIGNDGESSVTAELSQVAVFEQDGTLGQVTTNQDWNTSPAFGRMEAKSAVVFFPEGHVVPIKEEGYLHLNMHATASGIIPGGSRGGGHAIVYYQKKGQKS